MSKMQTVVDPVRKTVNVACGVEQAFRVFTVEIGTWWPTHSHSVGDGEITEVVFEQQAGGRIYERYAEGGEGDWGHVLEWDPPNRFVMSWYPAHPPAEGTELEVRFTPVGGGTRVELEHRGWEARGEQAAEARASYDNGWETVLGYYNRKLNG
jgi:uncharacterized protein YndB with AHSA1/START domain